MPLEANRGVTASMLINKQFLATSKKPFAIFKQTIPCYMTAPQLKTKVRLYAIY